MSSPYKTFAYYTFGCKVNFADTCTIARKLVDYGLSEVKNGTGNGPTHQAIDDIALMRTLPNMNIVSPADAKEMKRFMLQTLTWPSPIYIRLGRGGDPIVSNTESGYQIGKSILLRQPEDILIVASGTMVNRALMAAELLSQRSIVAGVLNMHTIKPIDKKAIENSRNNNLVVSIEEHNVIGGLGSAIAEHLSKLSNRPKQLFLGIKDVYGKGGEYNFLLDKHGLTPNKIVNEILLNYKK